MLESSTLNFEEPFSPGVSTETEEGMQLYRAFGGIGAILRYYVGH